jgi:formate hydrogenlyase subunit 6/NADH:ubiquinone oxidoreductase subunit I
VEAVYLDNTGDPFVCIHCGRCVAFCPHACLEMSAINDNLPVGNEKEVTP